MSLNLIDSVHINKQSLWFAQAQPSGSWGPEYEKRNASMIRLSYHHDYENRVPLQGEKKKCSYGICNELRTMTIQSQKNENLKKTFTTASHPSLVSTMNKI